MMPAKNQLQGSNCSQQFNFSDTSQPKGNLDTKKQVDAIAGQIWNNRIIFKVLREKQNEQQRKQRKVKILREKTE